MGIVNRVKDEFFGSAPRYRTEKFFSNPIYDTSKNWSLTLFKCYLRMPRSADVIASENAGRANNRSAYLSSGTACLGIWMP